jgi:Flp pilus assembly protein TadG
MKRRTLNRFFRDDRGNFSAMFALTLVPVVGLIGMAVDFTMSSKRKAILDAIADSASLAAVTPAMLSQGDSASITAATDLFNSQLGSVLGIGSTTLSVTASDSGLSRTVTVSYTTSATALFGKLIGKTAIPITGTSQSTSSTAPNIDFYLLLDNSPSMAIAATTSGINTMVAATPDQCAFACHESDTAPLDYYGLARTLGVTLRMDLVAQATQNLMSTAQSTASTNNANYRAAIYTFNTSLNIITGITGSLTSAQSQAKKIDIYEVPYQNWNSDAITDYTDTMTQINSIMPNPGNGTNAKGDTAQEVLFIVTDGVEDEGNRTIQAINDLGSAPKGNSSGTNWCTTIKSRGVKIAILYTDYLAVPSNSFYVSNVAPIQSDIGPALQACASPGLFYDAAIGSDLGAALSALFAAVTQPGHLTQ